MKEKKKKETGIRSILRVVVHLCYFNIREWPHYRILSANICALLGPRLFYVQNIFSSKVEKERERGGNVDGKRARGEGRKRERERKTRNTHN